MLASLTPRQWQLLAYLLIALVAAGCVLVILVVSRRG